MPLTLCTCFRTDPDTSEFGLLMREGDRAIAAMISDTGRAPADTRLACSDLVIDHHGTHEVSIRPGFTVIRPLHRVLAFSGTPANLSTILNNIK